MRIDDLRELVGPERYQRGCELVRQGRDTTVQWPADAADPHELANLVLYSLDQPLGERVALALALYRDMPCYAVLMYIADKSRDLGVDGRLLLWAEYRDLLSSPDDALAGPVAYSLAVDYLEDASVAEEAWAATATLDPPDERRLERVLVHSSWVAPWELKAQTYERLLHDPRWHPAIFQSLLTSAEEVTGLIDRREAQRVFDRLQLAASTPGIDRLRRNLREGWAQRR